MREWRVESERAVSAIKSRDVVYGVLTDQRVVRTRKAAIA
jgi:hypothetical protein